MECVGAVYPRDWGSSGVYSKLHLVPKHSKEEDARLERQCACPTRQPYRSEPQRTSLVHAEGMDVSYIL